jgi:ABC-type polysaccharide/polyol phosphate transport system ATPase subunit
MITLTDVSKSYPTRQGRVPVLKRVNLQVAPGEKIGILGRNGAGKSTVIRLISGAEQPDSGSVTRSMTVSWPIAFGGAFQSALTGLDNLRFICRIYGVDPDDKVGFVDDFAELGRYLREPVKSYSSGMRARLAFAISMVIEFDCFLIDEVVAVGDDRFKEKCQHELFEKRRDRAMIIVSHSHNYIKQHCERIALLRSGNFTFFDNMDEAYDVYASESQLRAN